MSLSESEQQAYYEVLYGSPQEDQMIDETDPNGTTVMYAPPLEEQGCQGKARLEVVGEEPMNDPEIQRALDEVFSAQQNDMRLETANADWMECMGDALSGYDLPDGITADGPDSMYIVVNALKAVAMDQQILPIDPDTGEPVGDYDTSQGYSSFGNEDGTGVAFIGDPTVIPDDLLEGLRSDELALWRLDWDCQNEAGFQQLRLDIEQDAVDDLIARFPQLGGGGE